MLMIHRVYHDAFEYVFITSSLLLRLLAFKGMKVHRCFDLP